MRDVGVFLDGVLRRSDGAPNLDGLRLLSTLTEGYRVTIFGGLDGAKDERFLFENGVDLVLTVVPELETDSREPHARKYAQVNRKRTAGFAFNFVVTDDPETAALLYLGRIPAMLYLEPDFPMDADPTIARPAWNDLVSQVEYRRKVKAERTQREAENV